MASIKSLDQLRELAPWFDITNYDGCANLTAREWAETLHIKKMDILLCKVADSSFLESLPLDVPIEEIDTEKLSEVVALGIISRLGVIPQRLAPPEYSYWRHMVGDSELLSLQGDIHPESIITPIRWAATGNQIYDFEIPHNANKLTYDEVSQLQFKQANLAIDLSAPDSSLIESFRVVLKKYRQHFNIPNPSKSGTRKNLERLCEYKVLAYLDIKLWESLTENKVTSNVIAWALFNGLKGERFISDTVKPLAEAALASGFISTLRELSNDKEDTCQA